MRFEFRPYCRAFHPPLLTSHGVWHVRKGIILRLSDDQIVRFGEIAPLEWFGSETFETAIAFCQSLPTAIDDALIRAIPNDLPACQFGFESAQPRSIQSMEQSLSALLPTGEQACSAWQDLWQQGYRTFKWKIGVNAIADELQTLERLVELIPDTAKLRLDANAGLNLIETQQWLDRCDLLNKALTDHHIIEFIEQPLPIHQFETMLALSSQHITAIALDESVATFEQLQTCYENGWRGIFVIKAAIAGFPSRLRQFCQHHKIDAVFSSVFETAIARYVGLKLASELSHRAAGYGITHWFNELMMEDFEELWQRL
ncbi:MAG: o-succinylbenzoate synthase [Myxacorys chilensis ATA2-1-KO14]|jgi:O-succinylbenzoate synthase|nr:o-succinylbenzoate synthase [Myxacorys chilensis ATA2-1-KO14]